MSELKRPPGPHHGIFDDLLHRSDPVAFYRQVVEKYGNYVHFIEEGDHVYLINEPQLIHDVLFADTHRFAKPYVEMRKVLGDALAMTSGDVHDSHRRTLEPAFKHAHGQAWGGPMVEYAVGVRDRLQEGKPVDMYGEMNALTVAVICKTMLDVDVRGQVEEIRDAVTTVYDAHLPLGLPFSEVLLKLPLPGNLQFRDGLTRLYKMIEKIIEDRKAEGRDHGDLLSFLLSQRAAGTLDMTDQQLHDEIQGIFLAGHETTANALSFTWYLLSQNPEVEKKFHEEIDTVLGDRLPTVTDIPALKYVRRVFSESLRLYPPAWLMGRRALETFELGEYTVPEGTVVRACSCITHRDPRFWEDPDRFDPDRFLPERSHERPKYAWLPFGGGPYACIGEGFAWMEAIIALSVIGRRWRLTRDDSPLHLDPRITLRPKGGVHVIPELRQK